MTAMATRVRTTLVLGATAAAVGALAGCGGGSGNSFTIKADDAGHVAYLVVDSAIPRRALAPVLINGMQSEGMAFVTSSKPVGALDCSWRGAFDMIGIPGIPTFALQRRYDTANVSVKVYGSGAFADSVCSDLQAG
jgi:hypothetical protein